MKISANNLASSLFKLPDPDTYPEKLYCITITEDVGIYDPEDRQIEVKRFTFFKRPIRWSFGRKFEWVIDL